MQAGQGCFIAVVGPSGAGKDTLINWLRPKLEDDSRVMFVRRAVTRDADGATEDHDALDREAFAMQEEAGRYAVCWKRTGCATASRQHPCTISKRAVLPSPTGRAGLSPRSNGCSATCWWSVSVSTGMS